MELLKLRLNLLVQWLTKRQKRALYEALGKVKEGKKIMLMFSFYQLFNGSNLLMSNLARNIYLWYTISRIYDKFWSSFVIKLLGDVFIKELCNLCRVDGYGIHLTPLDIQSRLHGQNLYPNQLCKPHVTMWTWRSWLCWRKSKEASMEQAPYFRRLP